MMDAFEAVSLTDASVDDGKKSFSPAEANRALPLVRRIVSDIVRDYERLRELHDWCQALDARGRTSEAEAARQEYVCITDHLSELKEELEHIGCELKDYREGLVDFPAMWEGRPIYLCWKLGEPSVAYWHTTGGGYAGRQPIAESELSEIL